MYRRIGVHRRIDYHKSAYQIPTFNKQIGTPANQRTQANRLPLIGVSDSNVQHNRLVHRRIGVHRRIDYHHSAYQIPTSNTTDWYTGEAAYRRPATGESPYQIPTFNTTDWYTGESAYTGESITILRRIRFQRPTQQISTPANRRTQANRLPLIGVSDSNVQHNRLVHRRIGVHGRIDYHHSAYQIPTFNTTYWYTGEAAYTGESITINRRIRFQRPTQQIGTPANRRTRANRLPLIGVSDSNVQHNRLVHRRIGVHGRIDYHPSAYQIPTSNTTDWYTGEAAYRRPATGDRRSATGDRRPATGGSPYKLPT